MKLYEVYKYLIAMYVLKIGTYKWLSPSEWHVPCEWPMDEIGALDDPFLRDCEEDRSILGKDIVERGMYFPIFLYSDNTVILGFHRALSLQMVDTDKKFLCIYLPDEVRYDKDKVLDIDFFGPRTYESLFNLMKSIPCVVRAGLYDRKEVPDRIFNDVDSFEDFISNISINRAYNSRLFQIKE